MYFFNQNSLFIIHLFNLTNFQQKQITNNYLHYFLWACIKKINFKNNIYIYI